MNGLNISQRNHTSWHRWCKVSQVCPTGSYESYGYSKINGLKELYFYNEKHEICIGTFYEEENIGISEFLSSDASALDKFIEKKLADTGHAFEEKNKLNVDINPSRDTIINKGQGALIVK